MPTNEHPAPLKRGGDARENWRTINQLNELLQPVMSEVRRLGSAIADLRMRANVKEGGDGGGKVEQFRFKSMGADTITCVRWDGTTEGEQITIYKPWKLRRTPWDGKTVPITTERIPNSITVSYQYVSNTKRTATSPQVGTETQYVVPRYLLNDVIYASPCDALGGSYLDLNVDARAWSENT